MGEINMSIKNLKMNTKYRYTKNALVGGLLGTIVVGSGLSLFNYCSYGMFKPVISKDDKIVSYEIDTKIYSKDGLKEVKSYDRCLTHDKIAVFKYKNNNEDTYAGWDISSLNKKQLEFIKSNVKGTDAEQLKSLMYYVSGLGNELGSEINLASYYNTDNEYGMKYIEQTKDDNNTKLTPIYKNSREAKDKMIVNLLLMDIGGILASILGLCYTHDKMDEHLYETTLSGKLKIKR
jgi:hypothetical protein